MKNNISKTQVKTSNNMKIMFKLKFMKYRVHFSTVAKTIATESYKNIQHQCLHAISFDRLVVL